MLDNFRKHTISSVQKLQMGSVGRLEQGKEYSPQSGQHQKNIFEREMTKKMGLGKIKGRILTEGNEASPGRRLLEKYKLSKLEPIGLDASSQRVSKIQTLAKIKQEATQRHNREKLQNFLKNPVEMIGFWESQDMIERRMFKRKLKEAALSFTKSSVKMKGPSQKKSLLRDLYEKQRNPSLLIRQKSERQDVMGSMAVKGHFNRSQGRFKTIESEQYKSHLECVIATMESNRKKLKREKNAIVRRMKEEKLEGLLKERQKLYYGPERQLLKEQRLNSRENVDDYRLFLERLQHKEANPQQTIVENEEQQKQVKADQGESMQNSDHAEGKEVRVSMATIVDKMNPERLEEDPRPKSNFSNLLSPTALSHLNQSKIERQGRLISLESEARVKVGNQILFSPPQSLC